MKLETSATAVGYIFSRSSTQFLRGMGSASYAVGDSIPAMLGLMGTADRGRNKNRPVA